ncbi:MAG: restriction endonuclease [Acidimicrobiales bacterium]
MIKRDKLGLDEIYVQSKRFGSGTVGRPEIQKFVGALSGKNADTGVFITTSKYSSDARDYANNVPSKKVVLIDGDELANLMIDFRVGVTVSQTVNIFEIDENFFEAE